MQTLGYLVSARLLDHELALLFDADSDTSALAWGGSVAIFGGAVAAFWRTLVAPAEARLFGSLAGLLAFLSVDEIIQLHERAGGELTIALELPVRFARILWPVLFLPLLGLVFVLLLRVSKEARPPCRRLLRLGLGLLVTAVVLESLSFLILAVDETERSWLYFTEVAFEEGAELGGWILTAFALTALTARAFLDRDLPRAATRPPSPVQGAQ